MGCPHHGGEGGADLAERLLGRRGFLRSALAAGGAGALSACLERNGAPDVPEGSLTGLPRRQFAWNDFMVRDGHDNTILPHHQVILFLRYAGDGQPTAEEREAVENAMASLDQAYLWGIGGLNPYHTERVDGLFSMIGYTASYFDRFEESLPENTGLQRPERLLDALEEPTERAGAYDAMVLLSSDHVSILLEVEQALFGNLDALNAHGGDEGVEMAGTFEGIFEPVARRSGFVGPGKPHEEIDERIHEKAPLSMGYKSGLQDNQATEDIVAIDEGPFADGTTMEHSLLQLDLEHWYEGSEDVRRERMFSPEHTADDIGDVGGRLSDTSLLTEELVEKVGEHASDGGRVGHTQKAAAARNDDFEAKLLRRSEAILNDTMEPGFSFNSLQRDLEDFVDVRKAMNGEHFDDDDLAPEEHGILDFLDVNERATFLIPPRDHRALPTPRPE